MGALLSCFEGAGCLFDKFGKETTNNGASGTSNGSYHSVRVEPAPILPLPTPADAPEQQPRSPDQSSKGKEEEISTKVAINDDVSKEAVNLLYRFPTSDAQDECPICLEGYDFENPKVFMQCAHYYHLSCAFEWMQRSATCPVCSMELLFAEAD